MLHRTPTLPNCVKGDLADGRSRPAAPRGPLSANVLERFAGRGAPVPDVDAAADAITDEDLQLALHLCYELHYGGFPGVPDELEWDPALLGLRGQLEQCFESSLRQQVPSALDVELEDLVDVLGARVGGRSVAAYVQESATLEQARELLVHRSAYQLKEADPHTWAIPRLHGRAKQLLVEIQAGEYGADAPGRTMHAELFAEAMCALGLDARRHVYLDVLPAVSLAVSNLASMLGLHRRLRGALIGHLALSETTSVAAMERYVAGLDRIGAPAEARRFFEVHVMADAEHAVVMVELLRALVGDEPALRDDVAFGVGASLVVERAFAASVIGRWERSVPSLLR